MSTTTDEIMEPSDDELLQVEDYPKAIPVCIDTPVNTRELPSKYAGMTTYNDVSTTAIKILGRDPRRKSATIIGLDQNLRFGPTQGVATSTGAVWPAVVPYVSTCYDELWASSVTSTTDISVIIELWAD